MASKLNLGRIDLIVAKIAELKKNVRPECRGFLIALEDAADKVQTNIEGDIILFINKRRNNQSKNLDNSDY